MKRFASSWELLINDSRNRNYNSERKAKKYVEKNISIYNGNSCGSGFHFMQQFIGKVG